MMTFGLIKKRKRETMWVDPDFKRFMKKSAAEHGMSIIEFSKKVGREELGFEKTIEKKKSVKKRFDFDF